MAILVALLVSGEIAGRLSGAPVLPADPSFIEAREWSYPDWVEKDADLFWRYRPSRTIDGDFLKPGRYTINSDGFRGPGFPKFKAEGVTRILCLGESTTFGLGVADADVWPRKLEERINALDPERRRWEVLNLGVTNYSTHQGVILARREFSRLQPDIVFYCYSWADHQPAANGIPDDRVDLGPGWAIGTANFLNRSAMWRWIRIGWNALSPATPSTVAPPGFDQRRVPSTDYAENIKKITREAISVGARPVMVTSPISLPPPGVSDADGIFHVHHRYRRLARFGSLAAGGEFVELANAFDPYTRFYDDHTSEHELFNAQGHAFVGEFLARYLLGDSIIIAKFGSQIYTEGR